MKFQIRYSDLGEIKRLIQTAMQLEVLWVSRNSQYKIHLKRTPFKGKTSESGGQSNYLII